MSCDSPRPVSPQDIVSSGLCIGCGSCVGGAGAEGAAMRWDGHGQLKPAGPGEWLRRRTSEFSRTCPFSPQARNEDELAAALFPEAGERDGRVGRYEAAYVGYAAEGKFRASGSSGGMVSWLATELLRKGLVDGVAHVAAAAAPSTEQRFFGYRISRTEEEVRAGAKSRYYPIELSEVLETIRSVPGRYAVVGIPCFIKAINLLRREHPLLRERIVFTLGLYCGHMKSARMVESFAWQMGAKVDEVSAIDFRLKNSDRPANWYTAHLILQEAREVSKDWWHLVDGDWGAGFFQNSACDFCDDVVAETADVSIGDAWVEPYSSDGRGTNVVVVRLPALHALLREGMEEGRLDLSPVDSEFVVQTQAAGFRQRREGLAFRLARRRRAVQPVKRIGAGAEGLRFRRKLIYAMRAAISAWSHRVFRLSRLLGWPAPYLVWARAVLTLYHGLAYSRGRIGSIIDRIEAFGQR